MSDRSRVGERAIEVDAFDERIRRDDRKAAG